MKKGMKWVGRLLVLAGFLLLANGGYTLFEIFRNVK
jgi:hypothetical protein